MATLHVGEKTLRQQIRAMLRRQEMDARDLADTLGLKEKEIYEHLEHIRRSAAASREKLLVTPSRCLLCGYEFTERRRLARPGRCPRCRRSKLQPPAFRIG